MCEVVPHALQARPAPVEAILYCTRSFLSTCTTSATTPLRLLTAPIQYSDTNTKADPRRATPPAPQPSTLNPAYLPHHHHDGTDVARTVAGAHQRQAAPHRELIGWEEQPLAPFLR